LDVRVRLSSGEKEFSVRALDICEGGLGLVSPVELAAGSVFKAEMVLPAIQRPFQAEVQAESRSGFRYGFRFVNVDEENAELIQKYKRRWGIRASGRYAAGQ
jgi:c-di-GMP-binding flagellar brake protein YcgR